MTLRVELKVIGQKNVVRSMDALAQHCGSDLTLMFKAIRKWWHKWQGEVFDSEGSVLGQKWAPLSPLYGKWKKHYFPGRPILQLWGRLSPAVRGEAGSWDKIEKQWAEIGIKGIPVEYALTHNFGDPKNNLPARTFLKTTPKAMVALDKELQKVLASIKRVVLREAGVTGK